MKRKKYIPTFIGSVETFEGESIEEKVQKLIENNEPIQTEHQSSIQRKRTVYYLSTTYERTNGT